MNAGIEIMLIGALTAAGCSLSGAWLVTGKKSMMSDSITHTILLGIVLGFLLSGDLSSPLLVIGAAVSGLLAVWLMQTLEKSGLISSDSAAGVVFPLMFSAAVVLITRYAGSTHLDTDSVLLGELAFAPFDRLVINGVDIGAKGIYLSGGILLLNILFILIFYKELKITSFDPVLASLMGFSPTLLHYGLMALVSITAVASFQTAGSVLVVAFMIVPGATAYLLTDRMELMLIFSAGIGVFSAVTGYKLAVALDASIAGCMACCAGIVLAAACIATRRMKVDS